MSSVTEATDQTFPGLVPASGVTVAEFWASWCGPCKNYSPVFEASATKNSRTKHLKVNVDDNPALSEYFAVTSIPMTVFIRDGIVVGSFPGALNASRLDDLLSQTYALDMEEVRRAADGK